VILSILAMAGALPVAAQQLPVVGGGGAAEAVRTPEQLKLLSEAALADARKGNLDSAILTWLDILDEVAESARPDIHANLAVAYKMGGHLAEAWHHLTTYLKTCGKEDKAAAKELQDVEGKLAVAYGKVGIACDPADASIYLQFESGAGVPALEPGGGGDALVPEPVAAPAAPSVPVGRGPAYSCPLTWWFLGGDHDVLVVKQGYRPQVLRVVASVRGGIGAFTARLEEIPVFGVLEVAGSGKAIQVFLNGALEGKVPFTRKLKPGTYELMVGRPGEEPWKKTINIEADKTVVERPPNAQPEVAQPDVVQPGIKNPGTGITQPGGETGRPFPTMPTVLMATGAALLLGGGITTYVAYDTNEGLLDKYPADELDYSKWVENRDNYQKEFSDSVKPLAATSYVLYGVGGAAAAAGAIWLIVDRQKGAGDQATGVTVSPFVAPTGAGLSLGFGW
jgi:hypothetical protein